MALLVPVYFFFPDFAVTLHPFLPEGILPDTYFSKSQIEFTFGWFGALEDAFLDAAAKMPGEYRLFLKETAGWLQQRPGITFDEIFRECAARLLPLYKLSEEERESFLSLGEKLGYLDREMQVAQLTLLEEELGYRIKTLKSAMPKQQKTYQSMGILGGILLAVLLW